MKKNIKAKIFAGFMVTVMMTACISGCGEKKTNSSDGVTTITVWSGNSHSKKVYEELVNKYNNGKGKEDGIFIDYQVKDGGTISQNLDIALQSGEAPDMFSNVGLVKSVENGYIAAIEDLPGGQEYLEKYKGKLINRFNIYNGKTYSVPMSASTQGLLYNKDMFRAAGIVDENGEPTPPETFEELREYAKKLTNIEKKQFGLIMPMKWGDWFSDITGPMQSSCGHNGYNPVTGLYDYSGIIPIAETFIGMREDGSVYPEPEGVDNDTARALFAAGNIGMKMGFSFDVGVLNDQFPAECDWGVAPYPVVDSEQKYKQRMDYGASFYINKKSLETVGGEKMLKALEFFTGDEVVRELYRAGMALPYDWSLVKDIELVDAKNGWKEFAELTEISARYPNTPSADMGSEMPLKDRFLQEVWNGDKTTEEIVTEFNNVMNKAVDAYYDIHTDASKDEFIIKDYDIRR